MHLGSAHPRGTAFALSGRVNQGVHAPAKPAEDVRLEGGDPGMRMKWLLIVLALLAPASLTAGPRVDFTGKWCSKCCDGFCPFDANGFYSSCFPDLDGTTCIYNDGHFLSVGGC